MSTTAALSISDAAVSYIEAVAGYDLAALPPSLEEQMASEMAAAMGGDGLTDQAIRGYAARAVTLNGTSVGLILVLEFESGWTSLPGTAEGFAQGVAGTGTPIPTTVAGRPAWFITTEATPAILTYLDADFAVTVFGSDEPTVAELGEALIVANG